MASSSSSIKKNYRSIKWKVIIGYLLIIALSLVFTWMIIIEKIGDYDTKMGITASDSLKEEIKNLYFQIVIVALIVTYTLGIYFFKRVILPIEKIASNAENLVKGNAPSEIDFNYNDEIGRLADTFNELKEQYNENLNQISSEKNKLETILKNMVDGMIAVGANGKIIHMNSSAMRLLNVNEGDIFLKDYNDIVKDFNGKLDYENLMIDKNQTGGRILVEHLGNFILVNHRPYDDEQGNKVGVIMVIRDITERQKLENMQKEFVGNVSHELKTPLTTIRSYTETLLAGGLEDQKTATKFLKVINSETERMTDLVSDLLKVSSLEHNAGKLIFKKIEIIGLLKEAVRSVEINAVKKKQHINFVFPKGLKIKVLGDEKLIKTAFLNIITNAIKYTEENGIIEIDAGTNDKMAQVKVSDNGIGISKKEMPRLFERFYRVDKARTRSQGGTGLGLFIVREIMSQHSGEIKIESQEGKGTKVILEFPLAK